MPVFQTLGLVQPTLNTNHGHIVYTPRFLSINRLYDGYQDRESDERTDSLLLSVHIGRKSLIELDSQELSIAVQYFLLGTLLK